ncbi:MAG: hypothetical protein EOM77_02810 [Bacteroidia bacterium]|nr:hypothetical protein [Bacteroidia bacterium]
MNKTLTVVRFSAIALGFLAALFIFLPLINFAGQQYLAMDIIFSHFDTAFGVFSFAAFVILIIASVLLIINRKHTESWAMLAFLVAGILFISIPDLIIYDFPGVEFEMVQTTFVIAIVVSFMGAVLSLSLANARSAFSTYEIVEMAMLVGLAVVLDLPGFKIRVGSSGGSIGFTMLPLLVLALRQGPIKGFIGAGAVYGFITCILDGWGLSTYPLDYLLGYGALALIGIFRSFVFNKNATHFNVKGLIFLIIGIVVGVAGRLLASTISGIIFYELDFWASLAYNAASILPSGGLVLGAMIILYEPLIRLNRMSVNRLGL